MFLNICNLPKLPTQINLFLKINFNQVQLYIFEG